MVSYVVRKYKRAKDGNLAGKVVDFVVINGSYKQARAKAVQWSKESGADTWVDVTKMPKDEYMGAVRYFSKANKVVWYTKEANAYEIKVNGETGRKLPNW